MLVLHSVVLILHSIVLILHSLVLILDSVVLFFQSLVSYQQVIYFLEGSRVVHLQGQVLLLQLHQTLVELGLILLPILRLVTRSFVLNSTLLFHILFHRYFPDSLLPLHD